MPNSGMSDSGMDEIRKIFECECRDGLDEIETGLLALEGGDNNLDTVNDIFRGAHSIKGGAATFGYSNIAEFTHVMETLLDKVRAGELPVSPPLIKIFLAAVDCLRAMVEAMDGGSYDEGKTEKIKLELTSWLEKVPAQDQGPVESTTAPEAETMVPASHCWDINFAPALAFLKFGNQPQHIFRALAELGKVTLKPNYSKLPAFDKYRPEALYLSWDIQLEAGVTKDRILEEFDWVESECTVEVKVRNPKEIENLDRRSESRRSSDSDGDRRKLSRRKGGKETGSIRVDIGKINSLLNLVGEMVINQSMLNNQFTTNGKTAGDKTSSVEQDKTLSQLRKTTHELQEAVMNIRMLPVSTTFNRYPRMVYDLSSKLDKKVELKISGETTELDKTVLEKIADPLSHLIRNSLDHGIESPKARLAAGKDATGTIYLSAAHEGGSVVIRVSDDGAGLNTEKILKKAIEKGLVRADETLSEQEINNLVFRPGFSTADVVTDVSGRGVGMDVVRNNIEDINGKVEVQSESGVGSTFQITLPLTLAILNGQLIKVGDEIYVIPLLNIVETVKINMERMNVITGSEVVYLLRGETIPVLDMRLLYIIPGVEALQNYEGKQLVIVKSSGKSIGLVVDSVLDQHQVVIKSLESSFVSIPGILGATILGDGAVSLIVDVTVLADLMKADSVCRIKH